MGTYTMFEYWFVSDYACYHVASKVTGDIEEANGFVREFQTIADVLAAYPDATFCSEMDQ